MTEKVPAASACRRCSVSLSMRSVPEPVASVMVTLLDVPAAPGTMPLVMVTLFDADQLSFERLAGAAVAELRRA